MFSEKVSGIVGWVAGGGGSGKSYAELRGLVKKPLTVLYMKILSYWPHLGFQQGYESADA